MSNHFVQVPSWATKDYVCSTCKGRKFGKFPHLYFCAEKNQWYHSCSVCLKKRKSRRLNRIRSASGNRKKEAGVAMTAQELEAVGFNPQKMLDAKVEKFQPPATAEGNPSNTNITFVFAPNSSAGSNNTSLLDTLAQSAAASSNPVMAPGVAGARGYGGHDVHYVQQMQQMYWYQQQMMLQMSMLQKQLQIQATQLAKLPPGSVPPSSAPKASSPHTVSMTMPIPPPPLIPASTPAPPLDGDPLIVASATAPALGAPLPEVPPTAAPPLDAALTAAPMTAPPMNLSSIITPNPVPLDDSAATSSIPISSPPRTSSSSADDLAPVKLTLEPEEAPSKQEGDWDAVPEGLVDKTSVASEAAKGTFTSL